MKTVIIVQARMGSTRLPGKIMKEILGQPLLFYQLERLRRVTSADDILVATTVDGKDDIIVDFCLKQRVKYYRGSEEDVLARYYEAARESGAEVIVRVTSDCPLIDAAVIDRVIRTYKENIDKVDYVANTLVRSYPRGLDCEVFPFAVLADIHERTFEPGDREHVSAYIYNHPDRYRLLNVAGEENLSHHRWTVDTPEDFELIRRMIEALYPVKRDFSMGDCLELLKHNPEWLKLNQHIKQKA